MVSSETSKNAETALETATNSPEVKADVLSESKDLPQEPVASKNENEPIGAHVQKTDNPSTKKVPEPMDQHEKTPVPSNEEPAATKPVVTATIEKLGQLTISDSNHAEAKDVSTSVAEPSRDGIKPSSTATKVPPTLPKLPIPQKPAKTAGSGSASASSSTAPATATQGGREVSKTIVYVGNISKEVTEEMLVELFSSLGSPVKNTKVLYDKNHPGFNYAFIEYEDHEQAQKALSLSGTVLADNILRVTWAFKTQQSRGADSYTLFVGDLSPEVNDDALAAAFSKFHSLQQGNVMWDMKTGHSRGYGFVSFKDVADAETALLTVNGTMLAGRPMRLNWAVRRDQGYRGGSNSTKTPMGIIGSTPLVPPQPGALGIATESGPDGGAGAHPPIIQPPVAQSYEMILQQAPAWLSAVYLGNLARYTTQNDLIPLLQNFGYIVNFKMLPARNCAFVTYDSHERAALAIMQLNGFTINRRPLRCGWGKANKGARFPGGPI